MKGILRKTHIWQVEYQVVNSFRFLPLHSDSVSSIMMDADSSVGVLNGMEVEFEIVKEYVDAHTNQVQEYASINGYYKKPIEISDIEISKQAQKHGVEENSFFTESTQNQKRLSFFAGAKWYREQLKKKI